MMLAGIRVLELGQNVAAPYASAILADLGAEVIKVEKPGGEEGRKLGPPFAGADPAWFHQVNRNKKSVVIDIKSAEGHARLLRLMGSVDVFLHNVRPGALSRAGLGPDAVRPLCPRLIYVDVTAFGHVGPLAGNPGYELLMQAYAGIMSITGGEDAPPTRAGPSIVDLTTGMWIAIGVLAAMVRRGIDGKGCVVNTSLYESGQRRPPQFGGPVERPDEMFLKDITAQGMSPEEVGQQVVRAIVDNQFYIFTHASVRAPIEARHARILAALDRASASQQSGSN